RLDLCYRLEKSSQFRGLGSDDGKQPDSAAGMKRASSARYQVRVKNMGNVADTYTLRCVPDSSPTWSFNYLDAANKDITRALCGGGWKTAKLEPGHEADITVLVTPRAGANSGETAAFSLLAKSGSKPVRRDHITVTAKIMADTSNRLNQTMQRLTVIATILSTASALTGFYGMNLSGMKLLGSD
ncbi:MAG TPA: CorA family divalent cation transporter, partial [Armatimonadota bacterium]